MRYERGDVVVVNLEPIIGSEQAGKSRPCVVVSPSEIHSKLHGVIICPITDAAHIKQTELGLVFVPAEEGGLVKDSLVVCFQIRMIDKRRILRKLGSMNDESIFEVGETLKLIVGAN